MKKRGFTFVELLVVFIIIGVLSGMLLLTTLSGRDKAMATRIISDMRTLKSAALMHYHEEEKKWPYGPVSEAFWSKYLDRKAPESGDKNLWYSFDSSDQTPCLVVANLPSESFGIRKKLASMASEAGIFEDKNLTRIYGETSPPPQRVYMPVAPKSPSP
jgi:general secretion pathway protein G